MRIVPVILLLLIPIHAFGATINHPNLPSPLPAYVDALDFFVPSGSAVGWIIGGHQTAPLPSPWGTKDPENTKLKTYAMVKFNDGRYFEIYKVDGRNIYIRYEANLDTVRGFDTRGDKKGEIFVARKVPTSASRLIRLPNFSTHTFTESKKRWYLSQSVPFFTDIADYQVFPVSDPNDYLGLKSYLKGCNCGLDNLDILTHFDYWQSQGKIVEFYSYGYGVGLVAWRWTENLTLNNGTAVQKHPDGSGTYTCYLQSRQVTIKNWMEVLGSSTKSVAPKAFVSLHSSNDTRVYTVKLNNPNINQADWYVACQDNVWSPLTARQGILSPDLSESKSLPLPRGIFALPFEYPTNLKTDSTFNKDDGSPHIIQWDRAVVTSDARQGMKFVQSYKVVLKQGPKVQGTYIVSGGKTSFTVPAEYPRGKYQAFVSAQEGNRQNIAAKLLFKIN
jgi:hypothetical protein